MKQAIETSQRTAGFTLIELLVVVAIIGILAAVAIPQFMTYRMRAFNSAALSDLKNLQKAQWAYFSDWEEYGLSVNTGAAAGAHGNGGILTGPAGPNDGIGGLGSFMQIGLSNNVSLVANTEAAPGGVSYAVIAKHPLGDRIYGGESEDGAVYFRQGSPTQALVATGVVMPSTVNPDFAGAAGWAAL